MKDAYKTMEGQIGIKEAMQKTEDEKSRGKTKIIVERVFGNLDLINLYAEYVAENILDKGLIEKDSA